MSTSTCGDYSDITAALMKDPKHAYFTCHMYTYINDLTFEARTKNVSSGAAVFPNGMTVCEGNGRKLTYHWTAANTLPSLVNHTDGSALITMSLVIVMLVILLVQMFL